MLLPNLLTVLGLCAGLTSIRFVLAERYEMAAILIIFAALIDGVDGRLARRLQASSEFGAELDSLADFLNFGVAPALLVFQHTMSGAGGLGWTFALVFACCCCLRLARFNVTRDEAPEPAAVPQSKRHFVGVPAPAGALLGLLPVFLSFAAILDTTQVPVLTSLYLGLVGMAMVSRLPTLSPKSIFIRREQVLWVLIAVAAVTGLMLTRFWWAMILLDLVYAGSLIHSAGRVLRGRRRKAAGVPAESPADLGDS
jgi:CDP-diacylglycerol--serine O-phosphatidyltransferase